MNSELALEAGLSLLKRPEPVCADEHGAQRHAQVEHKYRVGELKRNSHGYTFRNGLLRSRARSG